MLTSPLQEPSLDLDGWGPDAGCVGPLLCLVSATCFGAMAVFGKFAYEAGVTPAALVLLRFALAALLLLALLRLRPGLRTGRPDPARGGAPARLPRRVVLTALGLGAFGYATQASLFFAALERTDASLVALVFYTYPALVTLAAALLGRERLTPPRAAALAVASCGTLLVLLGAGGVPVDVAGVTMAFGCAVTYTAYILVADGVVHRVPPVVLSALVMSGAAVALALRALVSGGIDLGFGPAGWFWIGCIAVVCTVVAMLTFFAGLRRVGPSGAAILSTLEPVVTAALAAVALGEVLTPLQAGGGLLVLASVAVLQLRPRRRAGSGPDAAPHGLPDRRAGVEVPALTAGS
ncbi:MULTISPECIES: DMT family transporter [unclassified Blastococcus]|uniref:DMT family transporter n=1 Tax=Blastococcus sp. TML/C7B TaxID=2798728 RepID=UPI002104B8C5